MRKGQYTKSRTEGLEGSIEEVEMKETNWYELAQE